MQTAGVGGYILMVALMALLFTEKTATNAPSDFVAIIERTSTALPDDPNARVKVQTDNLH